MKKNYFDDEGNLIIRPYRLKDLVAIYGVCRHTLRKWINAKAPEYGSKDRKYFTVDQARGIVTALGAPQKLVTIIPIQSFQKAS